MSRRDEIRKQILANIRATHPGGRISDEDLNALIEERLQFESGVRDAARDSLSKQFGRVTIG